ncbi:MAG TPA: patatin-like phospholipase family protein [Mycobacterium sp.]|nr:patatin-like phospholipase family protein [Mycobacterium sp.]
MTLALVLAGGGVAGIAWETGVLRGIADELPAVADSLLNADVLVGTSAGAAVAAQISSGTGLDELFARQVAETSPEIDPGVDIAKVTELFLAAMTEPNTTVEQKLQRIGAVALAADTVAAPVRREVIARRLPAHHWPDRTLRITAIDIATGKLVAFDRDSGVDLIDAVAASCAVPGAWPPVRIDGRYYLDGGIGSMVNLGIAGDCDRAVVLVPSAERTSSPFSRGVAAEVAGLDGRAVAVFADIAACAAFGANPLNPACRVPSAWAGREQGRRQAAAIATFLAG